MIFILTICCNFLLLIYSMVNCHTGSLEIKRLCEVFGVHVNCHTGSLESSLAEPGTFTEVNCHTGSLENPSSRF